MTTLFYIMYVDLWMPGCLVDEKGQTLQLMNDICDLTQFVVPTIVKDTTSEYLAKLFMENVVLSFGMVVVVVVDADSKFLHLFQAMCIALNIVFWPLSRGNHKDLSVERYHRFINETQTIVGQDRGTRYSFIENTKTSQYAWNSAPINNTNIPQRVAAVGRQFRFSMDVDLIAAPIRNDSDQSALYGYMCNVSSESIFATLVLQILVEEWYSVHLTRCDTQRVAKDFKVVDVVKSHVQVNSNYVTGAIQKNLINPKDCLELWNY